MLLIAYGGYVVVSTGSPLFRPSWGCLPGDFPRYSHVTIQEIDQTYDSLPLGAKVECRMRMGVADPYSQVYDFYYKGLSTGDWSWSAILGSEQTGGSIISFNRRSRPDTRGSITIHHQPRGTPFEVELIS